MSPSFYFDENVPYAIARGLRGRGIEVLRVQEDGRSGSSDPVVLDRATELGLPLFSLDEDLLVEARRRVRAGIPFAGVLYAHPERISIGGCVQDLELIARLLSPAELCDRIEYLPL